MNRSTPLKVCQAASDQSFSDIDSAELFLLDVKHIVSVFFSTISLFFLCYWQKDLLLFRSLEDKLDPDSIEC